MTSTPTPEHREEGSEPRSTAEMQVQMYQRESPHPSPAELQAYYDISPEVGERILNSAERALDHHHQMQHRAANLTFTVIVSGTVVLLAVTGAAVYIAVSVTAVGGVVLGASPVGLLGLTGFSALRRRRRKASKQK